MQKKTRAASTFVLSAAFGLLAWAAERRQMIPEWVPEVAIAIAAVAIFWSIWPWLKLLPVVRVKIFLKGAQSNAALLEVSQRHIISQLIGQGNELAKRAHTIDSKPRPSGLANIMDDGSEKVRVQIEIENWVTAVRAHLMKTSPADETYFMSFPAPSTLTDRVEGHLERLRHIYKNLTN